MKNFDEFKNDFKRDIVVMISLNLKYGRFNEDMASALSRRVLEALSLPSEIEVFKAINKLIEIYPDVADSFIKRINEYDLKEKDRKLKKIKLELGGGGLN